MSDTNTPTSNAPTPSTVGSALLRYVIVGSVVVFIALLLILTAVSGLISTNMGTQWLLNQALARVQSDTLTLRIEHSLGTLLSGLDLQGIVVQQGENSVSIDTLQGRWNPMSLLNGEFTLDRLHIEGVQAQLQQATTESEPTPLGNDPFAAFLPLPIDLRFQRVTIEDINITMDNSQLAMQSLSLEGSLVNKRLQIERLQLVSEPLQINAQAQLDLIAAMPLSSQISWAYTGPITQDLQNARGNLQLRGNLNILQISHQLTQPMVLNSDGELRLYLLSDEAMPAPSFELRHEIAPQVLAANSVSDNRQLRIESAQITTQGDFTEVDFAGAARVSVEDAQGNRVAPELGLDWHTRINGQQLDISQAMVSTSTGFLQGNGQVQWGTPLQVNLQLDVQESDGSAYQPFLPEWLVLGALNGSAQLSLEQRDEQLEGSLAISSLTGELNDYPLLVDGDLRYNSDGLTVDELNARSGSTQLQVDGTWADTIDFNWQLAASDLSTLSPLFSGSIDALGRVEGSAETPQIDLTADAQNLNIAGVRVGTFTARGEYLNNSNRLQVRATGIEYNDTVNQQIDLLEITADGLPAAHNLTFAVSSPLAAAQWSLSGALLTDGPVRWAGSLENAQVDSELGVWSLAQAATMTLSQSEVSVPELCWQQSPSTLCLEAQWRSDGALTADIALSDYPLSLFNSPLPQDSNQRRTAPLLPPLPTGSRAEGMLDASLSVAGQLGNDLSGLTATFAIDAGQGQIEVEPAPPPIEDTAIADQELPETETFYWRTANLTGRLEQSAWTFNSALDFYQPNLANSGMSVQGNADALLLLSPDNELDGQLNLAFDDLSWIEAFVPSLQNTQGRLTGLSIISGTIESPKFGGNLALEDAAVDIPELGLELRDIESTVTSDISQTIFIQGRASSGEGTLRFESEILAPLSEERAFNVSLSGANFTLLNDPEILLTMSPDLRLEGDAEAVHISGNLILPIVDVRITSLPESAVDISADTVVLASTSRPSVRNAANGNPSLLDDMRISSDLKITLGDQARFRGFGLDTELAGALEITQRDSSGALTYGELTVEEGVFQTYGRTLTIEHGKLLFFGSLNNPALDIRAVRQADDVKVGVQMNGTLRNIRSQLFSTPTLPDGDIIAVMLTGRPLAEVGSAQDSNALMGAITSLGINQGQSFTNQVRNQLGLDTLAIQSTGDTSNSSLTLGKYLTPKLFIRYGVGLFETESTLSVDYSISENIKLEAKSGSSQSVDIKYTIER